jgi:hypothetical protein
MSVTCNRSVVYSGYFAFLHQENCPPRYNWNIVESGVKHHHPNQANHQKAKSQIQSRKYKQSTQLKLINSKDVLFL